MRHRRSIICTICQTDTFYFAGDKCQRCAARIRQQQPEYKEKARLYREKTREKMRAYQKEYWLKKKAGITSKALSAAPPSSNGSLGLPKGMTAKQMRDKRRNRIKYLDEKVANETETFVCEKCGKVGKTDPAHIISRTFQKTRHLKENIRRKCRECHDKEPRELPHKPVPRRLS